MDTVYCGHCNCRHPKGEHTSRAVRFCSGIWNFYFGPLWRLGQGPFGLLCWSILILAVICAVLGPSWEPVYLVLMYIWLTLIFASILAPFFSKFLPSWLF